MRNRWGQDIKRGQTVRVHLPRGGYEVGEIIRVTGRGADAYLTLESGKTASIDDVHQIVTEHATRAKNPLSRVKVGSPSQRTGEAPTKRLTKRRKATQKAPPGYYANPLVRVKVKSPSQRTGEPPTARLTKRRKATQKAPPGYYANPVVGAPGPFRIEKLTGTRWVCIATASTAANAKMAAKAIHAAHPSHTIRVMDTRK